VSGGGSLATRVAPLLGIGHGERAGGCHIACPPKPTGPSARCKPGVAWHCRSVMAWSTPPVTDSSFLIAVEEEMDWWWQGLSLATADLAARGLRRDGDNFSVGTPSRWDWDTDLLNNHMLHNFKISL
jgi:hypothetical protein